MVARPSFEDYFMTIADAVKERTNCRRRAVGAVLVKEERIIATGYNGTPEGMVNCQEGGCERCADEQRYARGKRYDICICVHAEQNALLTAARFGIPVEGAIVYSTLQPCFTCAKELLQAKIERVYYRDALPPDPDPVLAAQYEALRRAFRGGMLALPVLAEGSTGKPETSASTATNGAPAIG